MGVIVAVLAAFIFIGGISRIASFTEKVVPVMAAPVSYTHLRSVGKGNSSQVFHPKAVGKNKCHAHIQCDSIIMDHAQVGSIPEIQAKHVDAAIIHEAAIGRINDEQLVKLRTLGMTEAEAENVIIENFLS